MRAAARHIWELLQQGPLPELILALPPSVLRAAKRCGRPLRPHGAVSTERSLRTYRLHLDEAARPLVLAFSGTDNLERYFVAQLSENAFQYQRTVFPAQLRAAPDIWFSTRDGLSAVGGGYRRLSSYCWVRQVLELFPLQNGLPARLSKGLVRRDLRALRDNGFDARLERSVEALRTFYSDIYLPHVSNRFAEEGRISSLTEMALELAEGTVLLCSQKGVVRSGGIVTFARNMVRVPWLGAVGGNVQVVREGGLTAVYYEALKLAMGKGAAVMDFSNTRPFVSDGVFRHKARWGCVVREPAFGVVPLAVEVNAASECARHFFRSFPLIHFREAKTRCLYGTADGGEIEEKKLKRLRGLLRGSDVSGLDVLGEENDYRRLEL